MHNKLVNWRQRIGITIVGIICLLLLFRQALDTISDNHVAVSAATASNIQANSINIKNMNDSANGVLAQPVEAPAEAASLDGILVDTVSDPQVTGYPDSRKVVRDSRDNVYVAYRKKVDDGSLHIFVAKLSNKGSKFTNTEKSIETELLPYTQRVPSLAIDEKDTLHVVWYGTDENSTGDDDRQIKYTRAPL